MLTHLSVRSSAPLAPQLPLRIHVMPEVQLRLAAVLGAELDMLLAALILHSQLIIGRSTNHIAGAVFSVTGVDMPRVVQRMRNVRPVRIAFVKAIATSVPWTSGK